MRLAAMSKKWSCETLLAGFQDIMSESMGDDEQKVMKEIQDPLKP